jgi:hypothetical protein
MTRNSLGGDGEQPDVIDHDQIGREHPVDDLGDGVIGAVAGDEPAEGLDVEPGDGQAVVDGGVAEPFEQM